MSLADVVVVVLIAAACLAILVKGAKDRRNGGAG